MKLITLVLFQIFFVATATAQHNSLGQVVLDDSVRINYQLTYNKDSNPAYMLLFVHGTGPNTYLNKRKIGRKTLNYYDFWAKLSDQKGMAFCSYSRRGVSMDTMPPLFQKIDSMDYAAYSPKQEVADIVCLIKAIKSQKPFSKTKMVLWGWSEGTIIAAMLAEQYPELIDALLLCGYSNDNLYDIIQWQLSGHSSMIALCNYFDNDSSRTISKEEYMATDDKTTKYRKGLFGNVDFGLIDTDKNGHIDYVDFEMKLQPYFDAIMQKTASGDDAWLWKNYYKISSKWLKEHIETEANKSRLLRLDLPIHIVHGGDDINTPVEGVYDIKKRFEALGKNNLSIEVVPGHDHDLNFIQTVQTGKHSEGIQAILRTLDTFK